MPLVYKTIGARENNNNTAAREARRRKKRKQRAKRPPKNGRVGVFTRKMEWKIQENKTPSRNMLYNGFPYEFT